MQINSTQAKEFIIACIKAKLVAMLSGSPGSGKSDIVKQIAKEFNLKIIDVRLSQCDPSDLLGFPKIDGDKATYIPMNMFPISTDPIPNGYTGYLLFFDEFNSASPTVQAAAYKIILDKQIGQHQLHPNVAIVCAGNLITDKAIVNRLSTAMQSRLIHLELGVDPIKWIEWANTNKIDHRIISYIHHRPDNLLNFKPDHNDKTFASPRTWEFVSKLIFNNTNNLRDKLPLLAGAISEAVAREFITYLEIYTKLPTIDNIKTNGSTLEIPNEPAMLYATSHMIAAHINEENINKIFLYINRLPLEFQVITIQTIISRNKSLLKHSVMSTWISEKGEQLFGDN